METEEEKAARLASEEEANEQDPVEELDDEGNPIEKIEEPWMKVEIDEPDQTGADPSKTVPVGKFVSVKRNLRGKISDRDNEIEKLRLENEKLKATTDQSTVLIRPKASDFSSDEDYNTAMDKYFDDRAQETYRRNQLKNTQDDKVAQVIAKRNDAVNSHYDRADKLIEDAGIKPELYKDADAAVRRIVESSAPKMGDAIVDQLIETLGKGSEKVLYYLGRNETALNKFQNLLTTDPSGMKAAVYLGQEKQRLTNPTKPRSQAPNPAAHARGDASANANGAAFKKKYDAAHKKNNTQVAYNMKKQARAAGVDVTKW